MDATEPDFDALVALVTEAEIASLQGKADGLIQEWHRAVSGTRSISYEMGLEENVRNIFTEICRLREASP